MRLYLISMWKVEKVWETDRIVGRPKNLAKPNFVTIA